MLTKNDLDQISGILDKKFDVELKPIHKKLDKLQKDLDTTIDFFDRLTLTQDKRITRIENHLHLSVD